MKLDLSHWKHYAPIQLVTMIDGAGRGPTLEPVTIAANCSPSDAYPDCRIMVQVGNLVGASLTVEQSQQIRELLARAEADVADALDPPAPPPVAATGSEGNCDSCSQPIRRAELVSAYDDATLHTGPCPGTEGGRG